VLFNQFHDIIPGSGVTDTREHATALYQEAYAVAQTAKRAATAALAAAIDTSGFNVGDPAGTVAEGAGVGFYVEEHSIAQVERGGGAASRIFHVFNALPYSRREITEVVLWDFRQDFDRIEVVDSGGKVVRHQLLDDGFNDYWQHQYVRILIEAELPALGYATYGLRVKGEMPPKAVYGGDIRLERRFEPVLENGYIRAAFDPISGALVSLYDKVRKREVLSAKGAGFVKIIESAQAGMTSWTVGRYVSEEPVRKAGYGAYGVGGALRNELKFEAAMGPSRIVYTVSLDDESDQLVYQVKCDWLEPGSKEGGIPQLQFRVGLSGAQDKYAYAVPGGVVERSPRWQDVPSLHVIATEDGALLASDTKYGFRGVEDAMSVTLIRSSIDPDPYPELGVHVFTLRVGISRAKDKAGLLKAAQAAASVPVVISGSNHGGSAPLDGELMSVCGAVVTGIKMCEAEDALIVRGIEANGEAGEAVLRFAKAPKACAVVNTLEQPIAGDVRIEGDKVYAALRKNGMFSIKISF